MNNNTNNTNSKVQNGKNYVGNLKQSTNKSGSMNQSSSHTSGSNTQNAKNEQNSSTKNCR
ncbi:MAG: hypothetical protein II230_03100 [Clostridia bacterium]|nr:hypothetical protein [Clostridia bacterium]